MEQPVRRMLISFAVHSLTSKTRDALPRADAGDKNTSLQDAPTSRACVEEDRSFQKQKLKGACPVENNKCEICKKLGTLNELWAALLRQFLSKIEEPNSISLIIAIFKHVQNDLSSYSRMFPASHLVPTGALSEMCRMLLH